MTTLPEIGDLAPSFEVDTLRGHIHFPEYAAGNWCILFAHPANFTSAWAMFSAYIAMKERALDARNVKLVGLSNEALRTNHDWSDKARRFIGIYLKGPVIEDLDFRIAQMYGLASGRRPQAGLNRLALIIDPQGVIQLIINRPLPNIEDALTEIEKELDRLQGFSKASANTQPNELEVKEQPDVILGDFQPKIAYFPKKNLKLN